MFFAFLFSLSLSIVKKTDYEGAMEYTKRRGKTFILTINSDSYQYPLILHNFIAAAHESGVEANYLVVDTYDTDLSPEMFNATQFPALTFYQDSKFYKVHYSHFGSDFILSFINTNNFSPIPFIATEEGLQKFKETAALGFIAALDLPSQHIIDFMDNLHREHYNEITVAFAHPSIFYDSGFYLFRFEDQMMFPLGDIEHLDAADIMQLIVDKSVPFTHHLSAEIVNYLYQEHQSFIILNYNFNGFYINEESAREAETISNECELNVTYSKQGVNPIPGQIGIWPSKEPQMCIIDQSKRYRKHYCVDGPVTRDSCIDLCMKWRQGKAKKMWKSDRKGRKSKTEIEPINAYELNDIIEKGEKTVIGIYFSDDGCLRPLKQIAKEMEGQPIKFYEFSLSTNDWSGDEEVDMSPLPRLVVYNHGKLLLQTQLSNETQVAYDQITHAFYKSKREKEAEINEDGFITLKKVEEDGTIDINSPPIRIPAAELTNLTDNGTTTLFINDTYIKVTKVVDTQEPITVKEANEAAAKAAEAEKLEKENEEKEEEKDDEN